MNRGAAAALACTLIALFVGSACANAVEPTEPQATTRLYAGALDPAVASFTTSLSGSMSTLLTAYAVPGAAMALVHDGQVVWAAGYGWADSETGRPVTPDTVFSVSAASKPVTAWGVMRLVEDGRLDLDAPIEDYISRWQLPPSDRNSRAVTARGLLSHTAGVSASAYNPQARSLEQSLTGRVRCTDCFFATVLERPPAMLNRDAGEFFYSHHNYTLLQLAVEEISGESFARFMSSEVLSPLGLGGAGFEVSYARAQAVAVGHSQWGQRTRIWTDPVQAPTGLTATASEVAHFVAAHMQSQNEPPGRAVLRSESVESLLAPLAGTSGAFQPWSGTSDWYALGYRVDVTESGQRIVSQTAGFRGWTSLIAFMPDAAIGIVVLSNSDVTGPSLQDHVLCEWLAWSGNGSGRTCGSLNDIYTVSIDGTDARRVVGHPSIECCARWSPDGSRLVFNRGAQFGHADGTVIARFDGSSERHLLPESGPADWSPDGERFALVAHLHGSPDIFTVAVDGSDIRRVTSDADFDLFPTWSPDGTRIAFLRHRVVENVPLPTVELWVTNAAGGDETLVTVATIHESNALHRSAIDWSPDGRLIAFASAGDIHVVELGDGTVTALTNDGRENSDPAWSPDGSRIAYSAMGATGLDIYVMRADGSAPTLIVDHPADDFGPAWSPDGLRILFVSNRSP